MFRFFLTGILVVPLALLSQDRPREMVTRDISLAEAIQLAVRHNLDLQIERFNPRLSRIHLDLVGATWDPTLDFTYQHSFFFQPGAVVIIDPGLPPVPTSAETESDNWNAGVSGSTPIGLSYDVGTDLSRRESTSIDPDKDYNGNTRLTLRQPVLRNLLIDSPRYQLKFNRKSLQISEYGLQYQAMVVVNQVQQAYYELIFSTENVKVQEAALDLAERLLADNRKKVEVGSMAPLEEKQAQSQARARKADKISAEAQRDQAENALKQLLSDDFNLWINVRLVPTDPLQAVPQSFDISRSLMHGLTYRPDLRQSQIDLERRDITTRFRRNQRLPQLDLLGSYGYNALSGTVSDTYSDIRDRKDKSYTYGLAGSIPLGNRTARYNYRVAQEEKSQAEYSYRRLEQDIQVQILDAVNNARLTLEQVDARREAKDYAQLALEAEQKKLDHGKSIPFNVLQLQNELTSARFLEIQAVSNYNKALANLAFVEGRTLEVNSIDFNAKNEAEKVQPRYSIAKPKPRPTE